MKKLSFIVASALLLSGCMSMKTYVDPQYAKSSPADIKAVASKYNTLVQVEFQVNGTAKPAVNEQLLGHVTKSLLALGVFNISSGTELPTLKVVVNNVADLSDAAASGFVTGLTFGAAGSVTTDRYEATVSYIGKDGQPKSKKYQHALHSTIGNADAPIQGVAPMPLNDAFGKVIEQVLINFVADMQREGQFTLLRPNLNAVY